MRKTLISSSSLLSAVAVIRGKELHWLDEIDKCVTFSSRQNIPITDCLKEILLRNEIALTYQNIEKVKLCLVEFAKSDDENSGLTRTSEIFVRGEDKKFLPIVNDSFCSHLFIRDVIWEQYRKNSGNSKKSYST